MVDFQSRDTRRGVSDDDGDETEDEDDSEAAAEAATDTSADSAADREAGADGETEQTDSEGDAESSPADTAADPTDTEDGATESVDGSRTQSTGDDGPSDSPARRDPSHSDDGRPPGTAAGSKVATGASATAAGQTASTTAVRATDVAVVTVGTTIGQDEDPTGEALVAAVESAGHTVTVRERLRGDYDGVQQAVDTVVGRDDVEAVVTAGGVGIAASEVTIEAVHPLFEKALPGFGEVFRTLLFEHIGTGIVAVRATAGIADGTPVFCLPADAEAAVLGIDEIIATEAPKLVDHLRE